MLTSVSPEGAASDVAAADAVAAPAEDSLARWRAVRRRWDRAGVSSPPLVCLRLRVADATRSRYRSAFSCSRSVTGKLQIAASPRICRAAAS